MKTERKLVLDSSLNARRIPSELKKRGRDAIGLYELGWDKFKDPELLAAVAKRFSNAILVTADDKMPLVHGDVISDLGSTLATIEPWDHHPDLVESFSPETSDQEAYEREIVHRWVHRMENQATGEIRRYFVNSGSRIWTPRYS